MEQLWQQLLQALTHLFPGLRHSLRAGVSEQAVREVEQHLDVVFPEELYTHFRLHNGSIDPLFGSWTLLSLEDYVQELAHSSAKSGRRPTTLSRVVDGPTSFFL